MGAADGDAEGAANTLVMIENSATANTIAPVLEGFAEPAIENNPSEVC